MRKPAFITLTLIAAMSGLAACDDKDAQAQAEVFDPNNPSACSARFDVGTCMDAQKTAQAEHERTAPRFTSIEACEAQGLSNCIEQPSPGGGSSIMPAMIGYMIGNSMGQRSVAPVYAGSPPANVLERERLSNNGGGSAAATSAAYRRHLYSRGSYIGAGSARPGSGFTVASPSTGFQGSSIAAKSRAPSVARGGFGATASSHSGGAGG